MNAELHPGDEAPAFQAPAAGPGEYPPLFDLAALRGKRIILCFYPYDDVPAATAQLGALRDAWTQVDGTKAELLGVSRDSVENHRRIVEKLGLPFALLTDEDNHIAKAYGIWLGQGGGGDIEGGSLTRRATFFIGAGGRVEHVLSEEKAVDHVERLLERLKG